MATRRATPDQAARAAAEGLGCVALRARRLSRLVTRLFEQAFREHRITIAQFSLLGATVLEGPLQPAQLARLLDLEKSTLSRNLRLLEAAGLVRIGSPAAGAGQLLSVTGRGRRALVEALPAWRRAQARAARALGDAALKLDSMIAALGRASASAPPPAGGKGPVR